MSLQLLQGYLNQLTHVLRTPALARRDVALNWLVVVQAWIDQLSDGQPVTGRPFVPELDDRPPHVLHHDEAEWQRHASTTPLQSMRSSLDGLFKILSASDFSEREVAMRWLAALQSWVDQLERGGVNASLPAVHWPPLGPDATEEAICLHHANQSLPQHLQTNLDGLSAVLRRSDFTERKRAMWLIEAFQSWIGELAHAAHQPDLNAQLDTPAAGRLQHTGD